jgi:hypothetical protein
MAAAAGAEAILFSRVTREKESDLIPCGTARGTGRSAVNTGGTHGKDELAVGIYVALLYGLPPLLVGFDWFHLPTRYAGFQSGTIRFLRSK